MFSIEEINKRRKRNKELLETLSDDKLHLYEKLSCKYFAFQNINIFINVDFDKLLFLDICFEILLIDYGTLQTIKLLKLKDRYDYKKALEKDLKYRNADLYHCRRVFKYKKQIRLLNQIFRLTHEEYVMDILSFQDIRFHSPHEDKLSSRYINISEIKYQLSNLLKLFRVEEYELFH